MDEAPSASDVDLHGQLSSLSDAASRREAAVSSSRDASCPGQGQQSPKFSCFDARMFSVFSSATGSDVI